MLYFPNTTMFYSKLGSDTNTNEYFQDNDNHTIELNADNAFNYWFLPGY